MITNKKAKKQKQLMTIPLTITAILGACAIFNVDTASADSVESNWESYYSQQSNANYEYSTLSTNSVQSAWENYQNQ
ncbi:TPA: hypothetical protein ACSPJ7_005712, partial [Bacillus cereus]